MTARQRDTRAARLASVVRYVAGNRGPTPIGELDQGRAKAFAEVSSDDERPTGWRWAVRVESSDRLQPADWHLTVAAESLARVAAECAAVDQALDLLFGVAPEVRERLHTIGLETAALAAEGFVLIDEALDLLDPGDPGDQIEGVA